MRRAPVAVVAHPLITREAQARIDRHQVTIRVLMAAIGDRARETGDERLIAMVEKLASVNEEHRHLLDAVMEAFDESG